MDSKRHRATCGHKINEGITASIEAYTREAQPCLSYGTYCAQCTLDYYERGVLRNDELSKLIEMLKEKE